MLIEEQLAKIEEKINKEIDKAKNRFGDAFNEKQFRETNPRVLANQEKYNELHNRFAKALNEGDLAELKQIIEDQGIVCPISGSRNWTDVRQFNLMFSTEMGSTADGASKIYLRPETAQGIFVNYLNVQKTNYRFHEYAKLAHYANAAVDVEYKFPFGFKEVEGIHSRTDFDLSQHEKYSGKKIRYYDPELGESYVPFVVETSIGVDRMFLQVISAAYCEEELEKDSRVVLKIPPVLAPVKLAVMPLVKKDGLPEKAREIIDKLKFDFNCQYDEKDSIGKRYRRQDAIGTPFCVTVDHQSLEDNTVTIRYRDTMEQERVAIEKVGEIIGSRVNFKALFAKIQ